MLISLSWDDYILDYLDIIFKSGDSESKLLNSYLTNENKSKFRLIQAMKVCY